MRTCNRVSALLSALGIGVVFLHSPLASVTANAADFTRPHIAVGIGWSYLELAGVEFSLKHQSVAPFPQIDRLEDHDGEFPEGYRIDAGLGGFEVFASNTSRVLVGIKGFYSHFDNDNPVSCESGPPRNAGNNVVCSFIPLVELNPGGFDIGAANDWSGTLDRDVDHWGAAIETLLVSRSAPNAAAKLGVEYRTIDQELIHQVITGTNFNNGNPGAGNAKYTEDLDTDYIGVYIGAIGEVLSINGFSLVIDGQIGIYHAQTDYNGTYDVNGFVRPRESSISLSNSELSTIAAVKLEAQQKFNEFGISAFVQGEWYSYAPKMAYKSTDATGAAGILGDNEQTRIEDDDAFSFTAGARLTVPFGPAT